MSATAWLAQRGCLSATLAVLPAESRAKRKLIIRPLCSGGQFTGLHNRQCQIKDAVLACRLCFIWVNCGRQLKRAEDLVSSSLSVDCFTLAWLCSLFRSTADEQ